MNDLTSSTLWFEYDPSLRDVPWTTATKDEIRVRDMSLAHLRNVKAFIERNFTHWREQQIDAGYSFLSGLHGEMACDAVEDDIAGYENATIHDLTEYMAICQEIEYRRTPSGDREGR
jgi:hypothetical protein